MEPASSLSQNPIKPTISCIRCFERKVKCNKQWPCDPCRKHGAECVFRPPKRRKRRAEKGESAEERLKRYEALLQEKGIDPSQVSGASEAAQHDESSRSEEHYTVWQLPTPALSISGPQTTMFKPQLLHGQKGTKLVDK